MKLRLAITSLLIICLSLFVYAQGKGHKKGKHKTKVVKLKSTPPGWAKPHGYHNDHHVYFPDYHTFYDPNRGYVYWNNGYWVSTPETPAFLHTVDLNRARIQILTGEDIHGQPELKYNTIVTQYPGKVVGISIPIPSK